MIVGAGTALAQRPLGTDVSGYQPSINWTTVKNAGVAFAWTKATQSTGYVNPYFTAQEAGAKGVGIYVGAYHYAQPSLHPNINGANSADSEAAHFWTTASNYVKAGGIYCVPMLDWEDPDATVAAGFTVSQMSAWVNEWCNAVSNYARLNGVPGMKPVVYTGTWYSAPSSTYPGLNSSVTGWPNWIAAYPSNPNPQTGGPSSSFPWSTWKIWQYADTNWSGGDADVFNGTLSGFVQTFVIGGTPPSITNQPLGQIVMVGSNVTFTVGATGSTPLSYQWRFNSASIAAATVSSYTRLNAQLTDAGTYSVTVTNVYGTTNSANAVLTVYGPPLITAQPTNIITGLGLTASFSVAVSGSTPLSYQWSFNGTNLSGATTDSLIITNLDPTDTGTYAVVVTNLYGPATSSNALLAVMDPFITNQPQSLTVAQGAPAAFSVGAVGTAPLSYVWARNGVALTNGANITGQGSSALNIASVQVGDVGTYSVTVSNVDGTAVSSDATVVAPYAPAIVAQPVSQTVPAGSTVVLSVAALGTQPISYQWWQGTNSLVDGGDFSGAATATLTITNIQAGDMGPFSVAVTNAYGYAISSNALVTLWPLLAWGAGMTNSGTTPNYGQAIVPPGLSNVAAVACGLYHSLALLTDGTVAAWGAGQTNKGASPYFGQAIVPSGLSHAATVAAGYYHSLVLLADGTVTAWGAGTSNTGANSQYGQAMVPAGLINVVQVAAGGFHSLAVNSDGTVVAWGAGATATGTSPEYGQSIVPSDLGNVVAVSAGAYHSLALGSDGTVSGWGAGSVNTGSNPDYGQALIPAGLSNVVTIAAGGYHSLVLKSDGTITVWGDNTYGQTNAPAGLSNVVAVAAGRYNNLALESDGTLVAWGAGTTFTGITPNWGQSVAPEYLTNAIAVAGGGVHTLVLEGDRRPVLTVQPPSETVAAGAKVTYTAMAVGGQPLSYQWQLNGSNILGATSSALSLQAAQSGYYLVVVNNSAGSVTSGVAKLTVLMPSPILVMPQYTLNGGFQVNLAGAPGSNYVVEGSSNLTDWTPLETNTSPFIFSDTNTTNLPVQFYRAHLLP